MSRIARASGAEMCHARHLFPLLVKIFCVAGFLLFGIATTSFHCSGQDQEPRKIKVKVDPQYPELARRLNLQGTVRVEITVAADGSVKSVKQMGGNPVLLDALVHAVRKWRYEPADKETVIEVKFEFLGPN